MLTGDLDIGDTVLVQGSNMPPFKAFINWCVTPVNSPKSYGFKEYFGPGVYLSHERLTLTRILLTEKIENKA